jgi:hypothetical protein
MEQCEDMRLLWFMKACIKRWKSSDPSALILRPGNESLEVEIVRMLVMTGCRKYDPKHAFEKQLGDYVNPSIVRQ